MEQVFGYGTIPPKKKTPSQLITIAKMGEITVYERMLRPRKVAILHVVARLRLCWPEEHAFLAMRNPVFFRLGPLSRETSDPCEVNPFIPANSHPFRGVSTRIRTTAVHLGMMRGYKSVLKLNVKRKEENVVRWSFNKGRNGHPKTEPTLTDRLLG